MSRETVEVKWLRSGQPRRYADTVREAEIIVKGYVDDGTIEKQSSWDPGESVIRDLARVLVADFDDQPTHGLQHHLESIKKLAPGHWRVLIIEPYCD
jgi:hypothetical protein